MKILLKYLFIVSISFWLGSIFFFSSITAPSVFSTLSKPLSGVLISVIFDKYYILQYILAAVSAISVLMLIFVEKQKNNKLRIIRLTIISIMLAMTLFSGTFIRSSALEAKTVMKNSEPGSAAYIGSDKIFKRSHRNSVIINGLVFLMGMVILFSIAKNNDI
ncbi:MAG: DUF4149 domain-containing protein [Candidatus Dadabacteria bacterium]|nr:DUF4149 domain-containing protein [Candidatus Dadabacteria bacterium]NIT13072.1 DUF4149 domain-containing protein [Candidatus Dadabacteria bacterium]